MISRIAVGIEDVGVFWVQSDWVSFDDEDDGEYWEYTGNFQEADVEVMYEEFKDETEIDISLSKFIKIFIAISEAQKLVRHNQ